MASGFEILPAIDLRGGRVVRLEQGDFARETAFSDDPVAVAQRFADAGARWLHVVDLDGARTGVPVARRRDRRDRGGGRGPGPRSRSPAASATSDRRGRHRRGRRRSRRDRHRGARATRVRRSAGRRTRRRNGSPSRSTSATAGPSARAGRTDAAGVDPAEAIATARGRGRHDVRGHRDRARRPARTAPTSPSTSGSSCSAAATIIASAGIATVDRPAGRPRLGCTGAIVGRAIYDGRLDLAEAMATCAAADLRVSGRCRGRRPPRPPCGARR